MKKNYFLLALSFILCFSFGYSQNAIVGSGFSSGWGGGSCPTGNGDFSFFSASAGNSYITTLNANGTGNQYFRFGIDWGGTTSQLTTSLGSDQLLSAGIEYTLNSSCTTSGAMYFNVGSTSDNYIFKTSEAGTSPAGNFIVFIVQGDVRSVSSVTTPGTTYPGQTNTITATIDGSLSTGQGVYLRYTTDNFTTSTVVEMSGSGTTYTADIPGVTNTASASISYYIFTSGSGLTISGANADWYTINLNNNSNSNYSYSVESSYATTSNGNWSNTATWMDGSIPEESENVVINHNVTVDTDDTISNLTVNGSLTINSGFGLVVDGDLTNNGTVTANSGSYLMVTGTSSGNVTYKRNLGTENWYLVGSPVSGETFDDAYVSANSLAINGTNNAIATYNTASNEWSYMQTGGGDTFSAGVGYSVRREDFTGSGDISFTGTINTNNSGVDVVLNTTGSRFNLLANPYASHVNSVTFLTNESVISDTQTIWVWNQGLGADGSYEVQGTDDGFYLAPAQGFFVKANASGGTFNFDKVNQSSTGGTFQKLNTPQIKLWISEGDVKNYCRIKYSDNATQGFDVGLDGEMFGGSESSFAVYSHLLADNEGKKYQLQALPNSEYEKMVVPVGIIADAGEEIIFTAEVMNLPTGLKVFLEDRETNTFTRLDEANGEYKVTLSQDVNDVGRFYLHTTASALSVPEVHLENVSVYTTHATNIRIEGIALGKTQMKLVNMLGKEVLQQNFSSNGVSDIAIPKLARGIYIVQLNTEKGKLNKKIIID